MSKRLAEPEQVAEVLAGAGPANAVEVDVVGRAADGAERDVITADGERVLRVPRVQQEARRAGLDGVQDHLRVEPDPLPAGLHVGARPRPAAPGLRGRGSSCRSRPGSAATPGGSPPARRRTPPRSGRTAGGVGRRGAAPGSRDRSLPAGRLRPRRRTPVTSVSLTSPPCWSVEPAGPCRIEGRRIPSTNVPTLAALGRLGDLVGGRPSVEQGLAEHGREDDRATDQRRRLRSVREDEEAPRPGRTASPSGRRRPSARRGSGATAMLKSVVPTTMNTPPWIERVPMSPAGGTKVSPRAAVITPHSTIIITA